MDFERSDGSGTDDDLRSSNQNNFRNRGPAFEKTRGANVGTAPFHRMQNMEVQIHHIEQEAYSSVLWAFKAQSDAITWEMESLITELRKELRVTDDEHRKLLSRVNADGMIQRIRDQVHKQGLGGVLSTEELDRDNNSDPLIGRKVWTRWPEDNDFYEAVISDFNAIEGWHALVYDACTPNEAWEWVNNLREISPNDIRWKQEDVGISHRGGRSGLGHRIKKSMACGGITTGSGRGNGILKGQSKNELHPSQYDIGKKTLNNLEILQTDTLVKEVDKVFRSSDADPMDIEKARKDHEQALLDAIAKLEGISHGESDREKQCQLSQPGNISRKYEVREGSNGSKVSEKAKRWT